MGVTPYFNELIPRLNERSREATLGMLGVTHQGLRSHLDALMRQPPGQSYSFLADPVFEPVFPWKPAERSMDELKGSMIEPELADQLGIARPFEHQLKAWDTLMADTPQSTVITSGTGSGKTECFFVPILNDLVREMKQSQQRLEGVRALFLYPLNALINSQRERLAAWTQGFGDTVRFCLYNGNLPETARNNLSRDQIEHPNEVLSRQYLRESTPPILVTNPTMLEYTLVRQVDQPVLDQSQGQLRWIVLDEAHTYMGSRAAEIALLLRRVMHAFQVSQEGVRFVATSATIGDSADAKARLQDFLASMAGISRDQVVVIGARRQVPELPRVNGGDADLDELEAQAPDARYDALVDHPKARAVRACLAEGAESPRAQKLSRVVEHLWGPNAAHSPERLAETLRWIDVCAEAQKPAAEGKTPFLPLRAHLFHQVSSGLWACCDPHCGQKRDTALADSEWPFGTVYLEQREHCECGAPVYELQFCRECNTPHLQAEERQRQIGQQWLDRLVQSNDRRSDEFALTEESHEEADEGGLLDTEEDGMEETGAATIERWRRRYIYPQDREEITSLQPLDAKTLALGQGELSVALDQVEPLTCGECGHQGFGETGPFRHTRLGTPYYISTTVPTLLEYCQDDSQPLEKPFRGRRLITFTDSRQITARMAAKLQQDSERTSVRGLVFQTVRSHGSNGQDSELTSTVAELRQVIDSGQGSPMIERLLADKKKKLSDLGDTQPMKWGELVERLESTPPVWPHILNFYQSLDPSLFPEGGGSHLLAELLAFREFNARPKRQNTLETMGLVAVEYPGLAHVLEAPGKWTQAGKSLDEWKDFLKVCLDFHVRGQRFVNVPREWIRWLGAKFTPKRLVGPRSDEPTDRITHKWPLVRNPHQPNRLARLLSFALRLDSLDPRDRDVLDEFLESAWRDLTQTTGILKRIEGVSYQLDRGALAFVVPKHTWVCPVTNRFLDRTFAGLTPYLPKTPKAESALCEQVTMPDYPEFYEDTDERRVRATREWLSEDPQVKHLRRIGVWNNLSDRVLEGGGYYRAAEHSAQQDKARLKAYEDQFKEGRLNVLSCSTTMELGIDLGGISMIANNNVPPHPANYLQRAGRAGRRNETRSVTTTVCKPAPHDQAVFRDPEWPFKTRVPIPRVTLESERIVQRHANALLLAHFLKAVASLQQTDAHKLSCGWFYQAGDDNPPVSRMQTMLMPDEGYLTDGLRKALKAITRGSRLESTSPEQLMEACSAQLVCFKSVWDRKIGRLKAELKECDNTRKHDPYRRRVEIELRREQEEYLLSQLSSQGFLPAHGFPTGVAVLDSYTVDDFKQNRKRKQEIGDKERDDNVVRVASKPGRELSVALKEYAPGAEVVLDGLVYQSAGITLNWHTPVDHDVKEIQRFETAWRCQACGSVGFLGVGERLSECPDCSVSKLESETFVQPSGFAVDFYSQPSNDITSQRVVPAREPWVSARGPFRALPDPRLGRFRVDSEGSIYYHSAGHYGEGYAICMACGRAGSMTADGHYPEGCTPTKPHKKLRGRRGAGLDGTDAWCDGPNQDRIQPNVRLGYHENTDMLELALKNPEDNAFLRDGESNRRLAYTLAVALAQGLADCLGIGGEEIGTQIKPVRFEGESVPLLVIVLHDQAGGGAGFCSAAPHHFKDMCEKARSYLKCPAECTSACQSCLLSFNTSRDIEWLDRHQALAFLSRRFIQRLELPDELKLLGARSQFSAASLLTSIRNSFAPGSVLSVFAGGPPEDWEITDSVWRRQLVQWQDLFEEVRLIVPQSALEQLDEDQRSQLHSLMKLHGRARLCIADAEAADYRLAQVVHRDGECEAWSSSDGEGLLLDANWGQTTESVLVYSPQSETRSGEEVDVSTLAPAAGPDVTEVLIGSDLDGWLEGFGQRLWEYLAIYHEHLKKRLGSWGALVEVTYSDRYFMAPADVLILGEIINALRRHLGNRWGRPQVTVVAAEARQRGRSRPGHLLFHDWVRDDQREEVVKAFFKSIGQECEMEIREKTKVPHARSLTLRWDEGPATVLRLDQGIDFWRVGTKSQPRHDFNRPAERQAEALHEWRENLRVYASDGDVPTPVLVKTIEDHQ